MLIESLLTAVTFHYDDTRLNFLQKTCLQIPSLAFKYKLLIITNTQNEHSHEKIKEQLKFLKNFEIISYPVMGHPFFLTWGHQSIFKQYLTLDYSYSHFMYLEDDIQITPDNVTYWLRGRHELKGFGLYPSFVRYELGNKDETRYATDITKELRLKKLPHIFITSDYAYLNSPQPYQGMYLMDHEMIVNFYNSPACSPDFGNWNIREKATQGLTFLNVPKNFFSTNLIGYNVSKKYIDPGALIQHLPGNYANDPNSPFGKVPISMLIQL
jgi:hypothetical protein